MFKYFFLLLNEPEFLRCCLLEMSISGVELIVLRPHFVLDKKFRHLG